jgi:hypothetical protein
MPRGIKRIAAAADAIEAPTILEVEKPKKSGTVTVACKIPSGLVLQLQHKMKRPMPTGRGFENDFQMIDVNVFGGPRYNIFGPAIPAMGGVPDGYIMPKMIEGGYALTEGIPADFWGTWLEQNEKADYVIGKMIFAYQGNDNAKAAAREGEKRTSGLEPLSREVNAKGQMVDRRIPKPLTSSLGRIAFDSERDAERKGSTADA